MRLLPLVLFFSVQFCQAQDLARVRLTKTDLERNGKYHYRWESIDGHVGVIDLLLFKDKTFEFSISSNTYNAYSIGRWRLADGVVELNSDIQNGTLPIKITYRQRDTTDFDVKDIAFVRDLHENELSYAFVHVNNDSIRCLYGDLLCIGAYSNIDSVKVVLENGISSNWFPIQPHKGVIQINVLTRHNLTNYLILKQARYQLSNGKLKWISEN